MKNVLVIAPHPDDESLGCGGTLLRHRAEGDAIHWLIVTGISEELGFSPQRIASRNAEIEAVAARYGFASVTRLDFPTTRLDQVPVSDLVGKIGDVVKAVQPEILYLPYRGDVHSDHAAVFDAAVACSKWFRYASVKQVAVYETLSETDFALNPDASGFRPNLFVDISAYLDEKIAIMGLFAGEMGKFPFPRSETALRAQANLRGAACGVHAAEAFLLLKEVR